MGDHLEIHDRADLVVLVGHRRTQLFAFRRIEALEELVDHLFRQVIGKVGDLVGIELLGGSEDFRRVHVGEQRLAHRVGHLEQDLAIAVRLDQVPDAEAILGRQRLEDAGDVGRMQFLDLALELGEVLAMDEVVDEV